jgi:hypothetical protein
MEVIDLADKETDRKKELEDALDKWVEENIPEGEKDPMIVAAEQRRKATGQKEGWEMRPQV